MKIYTKTGDKGKTGILGTRVSKSSIIIKTVGSIDELNSAIGVLISVSKHNKNIDLSYIYKLQHILFNIGSILTGFKMDIDFKVLTNTIETEIDNLSISLNSIQNFILPGGSIESSHAHLCRSICRRVETNLVEYKSYIHKKGLKGFKISNKDVADCLIFINRLSDYFFTLARYFNNINKVTDIFWNKQI